MITKIFVLTMLTLTLSTGTLCAEDYNPVLGKAGDFILREADLDRLLSSQPPAVQKSFQNDPQQRANLVREILIKKAIVAEAIKAGFDKKPEIREQLSYVFDNYLSQEYLDKVVTADVTVPEEDLKKYYQEHEKDFQLPEQVKVRHILIASSKEATPEEREKARTKAEEILQRLIKGEDFSKLAREFSEDPISAPKGGELAAITIGKTNSKEFEKAAFALKTGQLSDIVTTSYGFHIIKMDERREKRTATFSEVRDYIYNKLKAELAQKKIQDFVKQAMQDDKMEIFDEQPAGASEKGEKLRATGAPTEIKK